MVWLARGLREGIVTSRYPSRPDDYGPEWRGGIAVRAAESTDAAAVAGICPTDAIADHDGRLHVDRGRCILCGYCVERYPEHFAFDASPETAMRSRDALVVSSDEDGDDDALAALRTDLARSVRALRRSVHIRHVDCGSDGSDEWEVAALVNPVYDVQRLGIFFTASPRHADLLLVTGAGAAGMWRALERTFDAMPDPKVVVAAGTDAISGGITHPSYATYGGVDGAVPVDVWVPGSPASPFTLLHGILLALGRLEPRGRR
jgi:Ni,Fe-hydrogenase III small subunit/ferredoxin